MPSADIAGPRGRVRALLDSLFPARNGERQLSLLLFFHGLFAVGAFVAGRSVRDALFMAHAGRAALNFTGVSRPVAAASASRWWPRRRFIGTEWQIRCA